MEFRNLTPFPALAFEALDQHNERYHVVAMRQTLAIETDGTLRYCDEQAPLVVADEYVGEINASSVRQESDLAPYKPKCDVIIIASAHSPNRRPSSRFPVNVRVLAPSGNVVLDKTLAITGPRLWRRADSHRWVLTEPEPISTLPVRYEYAYGGELKAEDVEGQRAAMGKGEDPKTVPPLRHSVVETNSVGRGYTESWYIDAKKPEQISAPQIEDPSDPIREFGKPYSPQGFGIITKVWLPRRALCGTIDDAFAKSDRWLPADFNFAFWNGAHPDLQTPFLQGDEVVELTNFTPEGKLLIRLPGHRACALVRYETGDIAPAPLNLDTLVIDTERMTVSMVNRLLISVEPAIRVLEARLVTKDEWEAALQPPTPVSTYNPVATGVRHGG